MRLLLFRTVWRIVRILVLCGQGCKRNIITRIIRNINQFPLDNHAGRSVAATQVDKETI